KEIGAKVNESGYASMLVNRIREVMRRRRLTAPDVAGPEMGLDPNHVSEYLDNTLGPDAVADVEKVCLDSDVHLAEVAASHQILTLVLGEPVDVPVSTRERMYAFGPTASLQPDTSKTVDPESHSSVRTVTGSDNQSQMATADSQPGEPFDGHIPDYLKPAPTLRRLGPVAVAVVVGGVWLWLLYFDTSLHKPVDTGGQTASTSHPAANSGEFTSPAPINADMPATATGRNPAQAMETSVPAAATASNGQAAIAGTKPNSARPFSSLPNYDPEAPPDSAETIPNVPATPSAAVRPSTPGPAVASTEPSSIPAGGTTETPPGKPTAGQTLPADTGGPATVPDTGTVAPSGPEILYVSRDSILTRKTDQGWTIMPGRTAIRVGDLIASPAPFRATLQVSSLFLKIELQAGSAIEYLGTAGGNDMAFQIHRGRIAIKREAPAKEAGPLKLGVRLFDELCRLTCTSAGCQCGIEITRREPHRFEEDLSSDPYTGSLFLIQGQASFAGQSSKPNALNGPAWWPLSIKDRQAQLTSASQPPLLTTPNWLDSDQRGLSSTDRRYAIRFRKAIDPDLPLEHSVSAIVSSPDPRLAEYAVQLLDVTRRVSGLVDAMARVEHEEARLAAISGLRRWLPQAEENRDILKSELEKCFPPDQIEPIYRLLWGYDDSDARNQVTSRILVDWLKHDNIVIRQLAFMHIYRLTGQRYDFRPINPPNQRRVAVDRWDQHLKKNDELLVK
ncbi:MAG: hypothetical protein VB858_18180, partial [Planctomycetaceae bacterium]